MPILSAAQASFAVRWETMDTMVCSIFAGEKSDVCASMDRLRAPITLDIGAMICSLVSEIIPVSRMEVAPVLVVVVGFVVGSWKMLVILVTGLAVVVGPVGTMAGDGVIPL